MLPLTLDTPLEAVLRQARRGPLWEPGPATRPLDLGGDGVRALLPHRPPFLLVDAVTAIDLEQSAIAGKRRIDPEDPVFSGHFPGDPVYPGVLLVEALAQLLACFRPLALGGGAELFLAASCRGIFLRPVRPGDDLALLGACIGSFDGIYTRGVGQVSCGGQVCALAVVEACAS